MATPRQPPAQRPARFALFVTTLTKLAGLAIAFNEALLRSELRPSALAVAAFMMAGAQVSEPVLMSLMDRLFVSSPGRRGR